MKRALLLLAACGGATPVAPVTAPPSAPKPPPAPVVFASEVQPAADLPDGITEDRGLDCIAQRSFPTPEPLHYRDELALACGSPLYPVDARTIAPGELAATLAEMTKRFPEHVPLAVGRHGEGDRETVVIAARGLTLEPFHAGDREIRGRLLVRVRALKEVVSMADGVHISDVAFGGDGAFAMPTPPGDADVVIAIFDGKSTGPLARVRVGSGSPLFAMSGALLAKTNAARSHLGLATLALAPLIGDCSEIPAQVGGIDVTDKASCWGRPLVDPDVLATEVTFTPLMQEKLVLPDAALLQVGRLGDEARIRVLRRFETLTPEAGRARVLAALRTRWPNVQERTAPLQAVLDAWAATGEPDKTSTDVSAAIAHVAGAWTPTGHSLYRLSTARDLDTAIAQVHSDVSPQYIDIAYTQVRDARGNMRHLIAVVLATPN